MVASSDFKKIKAKVGKRAPVKANVTDTSFRAGLHVSKQVGISEVTNSTQSATTRRGLSLHQLLSQLKHPTVAVRLSAVKGLKSLFSAPSLMNQQLNSYFSAVVVSLAPVCCIDDDPVVRKAAVQIFQELVQHLNQSSNNDLSQMKLLFPFVPYLIAIIATGLNSLDIQQRYDGAAMVRWLFEKIQFDFESSISVDVMSDALVRLVPPLTRLLAVAPNRVSVGRASGDNDVVSSAKPSGVIPTKADFHTMVIPVGTMKKSKRSKKRQRPRLDFPSEVTQCNFQEKTAALTSSPDSHSPKFVVLLAIHSLFRTAKVMSALNPSTDFQGLNDDPGEVINFLAPDVEIFPGQLNSPLLFTQKQNLDQVIQLSCIGNPISSLSQFPSWLQLAIDEDGDNLYDEGYPSERRNFAKRSSVCEALSVMEVLDILSKIRDSAIESSQSNESPQLFLLCIISVRFVLECNVNVFHAGSSASSGSITTENLSQRFLKICSQIGSCIVESFSMIDCHSNDVAELSLTLLSLANATQQWVQQLRWVPPRKSPKLERQDAQVRQWIQIVSSHLRGLLVEDIAMLDNAPIHQENDSSPTTTAPLTLLTSQAMLSVLAQLLLRQDLHPHFAPKDQVDFLFCSVFFNVDRPLPASLSRSDVGRSAAFLGCRLLSDSSYCLDCTEQESGRSIVLNILLCIPSFLSAWRADYLTHSAICLSALKCVVCRIDCFDLANMCNVGFLTNLWTGIESLLCPSTSSNACSVFEMYPEALQRRLICLICMSGKPTASCIKCLADVCARCSTKLIVPKSKTQNTVSTTMSSFVVQCIHNIRRTLPMHSYVAFLLDSTGILRLDRISVPQVTFMMFSRAMDVQLQDIARCLVHCGTTKIMPMLESLLSAWLNVEKRPRRDGDSIDQLSTLKARAGLCLLAVFSLDFQVLQNENMSISHIVSTEFMEVLVKSIAEMTSFGLICVFESADNPAVQRWISPFLVLFGREKGLMTQVFGLIISSLKDLDVCTQSRIVDFWSVLLKEPRIQSVLLVERFVILDLVNSISHADTEVQIPSIARMIAELEVVSNVAPKNE
jgi:hypothetical protein